MVPPLELKSEALVIMLLIVVAFSNTDIGGPDEPSNWGYEARALDMSKKMGG